MRTRLSGDLQRALVQRLDTVLHGRDEISTGDTWRLTRAALGRTRIASSSGAQDRSPPPDRRPHRHRRPETGFFGSAAAEAYQHVSRQHFLRRECGHRMRQRLKTVQVHVPAPRSSDDRHDGMPGFVDRRPALVLRRQALTSGVDGRDDVGARNRRRSFWRSGALLGRPARSRQATYRDTPQPPSASLGNRRWRAGGDGSRRAGPRSTGEGFRRVCLGRAGSAQRPVDRVREIGRPDRDDPFARLGSVQFRQQSVDDRRPPAVVVAAISAGADAV